MLVLIIGLVLFLGVHSVRIVAPEFRRSFIARRGDGPWKGLYTLLSIAGFVLIVWGYGLARQDPVVFWTAPVWMSHVAALLMLVAFIVLGAYGLPAGRIKAALKHPMLVAVKIWAIAHIAVNGDLASIVLFGSFLVWAVADRISEKRRLRAGETRNPVAGPAVNDVKAILFGVVLWLAFIVFLHRWLFGVAPIPAISA